MSNTINADKTYYLDDVSGAFESGCAQMMTDLQAAEKDLEADPSDPAKLAKYQAKLQEYTLFRNTQSNVVNAYKTVGSSIIQNFR